VKAAQLNASATPARPELVRSTQWQSRLFLSDEKHSFLGIPLRAAGQHRSSVAEFEGNRLVSSITDPASQVQLRDRCMLRPWPAAVFQTCLGG
jgi:hypothetical protein